MHKTESRYCKASGRRASKVGVGGGTYPTDEFRSFGLPVRAAEHFAELLRTEPNWDKALALTVQAFDFPLYQTIRDIKGAPRSTFLCKMRQYQKQRESHP